MKGLLQEALMDSCSESERDQRRQKLFEKQREFQQLLNKQH
jgi:hypothetical protein